MSVVKFAPAPTPPQEGSKDTSHEAVDLLIIQPLEAWIATTRKQKYRLKVEDFLYSNYVVFFSCWA